jgi:hypothetical protein
MGEEHRQTPQRTRREFIEEPWSRRTGAPQASATRRDRDPDADETHDDIRGRASTGWDGALALRACRPGRARRALATNPAWGATVKGMACRWMLAGL